MKEGETVAFMIHNRNLTGIVTECHEDERGRLVRAVIQCADHVRVTVDFDAPPAPEVSS